MMALKAKSPEKSKTILSQLMQPAHSNSRGNIHGGEMMKLMDEAGALASMRHAQNRVVTVAVDRMTFKHPVEIGDLVVLEAVVSYVGRTSLEAEINVFAENPVTGERIMTNTAYLVYVALDSEGKPAVVPELLLETDEHRQRYEEGKRRQEARLARL